MADEIKATNSIAAESNVNSQTSADAVVSASESGARTSDAVASGSPVTMVPAISSTSATPLSAPSTPYPSCLTNVLQQFKPLVDFEELSFEEKIGHGSYGVVYKIIWKQRLVAAKEFGATAGQEAIETEVRQLSRVSHPNIIELYAISANQHSIYLLMEYIEGGSLHAFLHGPVKPYYSTAHAMSWARQCAEGVAYLHAMRPKPLIHRDLKPLNLLLSNKGRDLKICDFGTVADQATRMTNNKGTAMFMAPEVFSSCEYNEKCDVFSWATVLWVVLTRQQPFQDNDNGYAVQWLIYQGRRPPINSNFPIPIQKLMTECWSSKPEQRPPMTKVLAVLPATLPGADEPLEYEFRNQQIVCADTTQSTESSYKLDFSNLSPSGDMNLELTPTNNSNISNTSSSSITPTNSTEGQLNFMQPAPANFKPMAHIAASTRWDVIPEESDTSLYGQPEGVGDDMFRLAPSASTSKRYETIRNGITQKANDHINPLTIDVDPNAWDLNYNYSVSDFAKSDGKERLTVTETKPMLQNNNVMAGRSAAGINALLEPSAVDEVEDIDGTDQSLAEMLDPELQPVPPIPDNDESQSIYREHRRLAKEYLRVDTNLYYAQDFKDKILIQLDPDEREKKQELLKKINEKQELLELYNNLKQQKEALLASAQQPEAVSDDDWVVIQPNQKP